MKVPLGMFSSHGNFCITVRHIIWIYMGVGGAFMLLTAYCAVKVCYTSASFEERDTLIIMHIPLLQRERVPTPQNDRFVHCLPRPTPRDANSCLSWQTVKLRRPVIS
jgi:hypothetical protein